MKRFLPFVFAGALLLNAQTRVMVIQLLEGVADGLVLVSNGQASVVKIGPTLTLAGGQLDVATPTPPTLLRRMKVAKAATVVTLPSPCQAANSVLFLNGLMQSVDRGDYTITAPSTLTVNTIYGAIPAANFDVLCW